ncbi:GNAT family N-acetyltransferase [Nocardioides nematodiphilus]|uniref:GNAT family N-acetyltransferase n=1 Tax=Nocardioides nematodiphilus TaxID=2849669 RepID=UPI001CD99230|nr:GNAT family protein [Nocardioides nematodiphilus]MCA1984086.1 GNAT family N-acetyltransferase [Nocardioides nematodiphilus]
MLEPQPHDPAHFELDANGLPVGLRVEGWEPRPAPERITLAGRYVRLEPLSSAHYAELFATLCNDDDDERWTYLGTRPVSLPELWMLLAARLESDPVTYAIIPLEGEGAGMPCGLFTLYAINQADGSVELGSVLFGRHLQRSRAATEAVHLMLSYCLDTLGYRRFEWKLNSLNEPSHRAARRFGFTYEGRFRNARVQQGRNRDTDWYSIIAEEWPEIRARQERWLDPANFDASGRQLSALR